MGAKAGKEVIAIKRIRFIDINNPTLQGIFRSAKLLRDEYGFEAYYNFALTPWLRLTPDIQLVRGAQKDKLSLSPLPAILRKKSIGPAPLKTQQ